MSKPNTSSLEEILEKRYGAVLSHILSKNHKKETSSAAGKNTRGPISTLYLLKLYSLKILLVVM